MQVYFRACAGALLLVMLYGCSAAGSLFSADAPPAPAPTTERDPPDDSCAQVAAQRADDAVMAFYVTAESEDQKRIYQAAYRECAAWHARHF